jgi:carbonic anhydrase
MENKIDTLVELNVTQQVVNVGKISVVQEAWRTGRPLCVHGVVYNLKDGILKDLGITLSAIEHLPEEFRISKRATHQKEDTEDNK